MPRPELYPSFFCAGWDIARRHRGGFAQRSTNVRNYRLDVLSANPLGRALYSLVFDASAAPNLACFIFLDPTAPGFYRRWEDIAHDAVGSLRAAAGHHPTDPALSELIAELSGRSEDFRVRWAAHDVGYYRTGIQAFRHPVVGDLDLQYDALEVAADAGLTVVAYTARPHTDSDHALRRLRR